MEDDFEVVAEYIHESIEITKFILTKLDGGAKAPLKVTDKHFDQNNQEILQ